MMKRTLLILTAAATVAVTGASAQLLINEVYPGGGASTGTPAYTKDYVEIYNNSATPISLAGYALQYSASGATSDFTNNIVLFGVGSIIGANDYITIETGSAGTAGSALATGSGTGFATYIAGTGSPGLSASAGSVRLLDNNSIVLDLVGYGTVTTATASGNVKAEGTSATAPTSTAVSIGRTLFADTNNNKTDFSSMAPSPDAGTASIVVAAPEPSTWACLIGGLSTLCLVLRRRQRAA